MGKKGQPLGIQELPTEERQAMVWVLGQAPEALRRLPIYQKVWAQIKEGN